MLFYIQMLCFPISKIGDDKVSCQMLAQGNVKLILKSTGIKEFLQSQKDHHRLENKTPDQLTKRNK